MKSLSLQEPCRPICTKSLSYLAVGSVVITALVLGILASLQLGPFAGFAYSEAVAVCCFIPAILGLIVVWCMSRCKNHVVSLGEQTFGELKRRLSIERSVNVEFTHLPSDDRTSALATFNHCLEITCFTLINDQVCIVVPCEYTDNYSNSQRRIIVLELDSDSLLMSPYYELDNRIYPTTSGDYTFLGKLDDEYAQALSGAIKPLLEGKSFTYGETSYTPLYS